jgi:polyisoprenoid-binding protein YceI
MAGRVAPIRKMVFFLSSLQRNETHSPMKVYGKRLTALALFSTLVASATAAVDNYTIDPAHSAVAFNIRHFVSKVPGNFGKVEGTIGFDKENPEKSTAEAKIDVASISTANEKRDTHLKSGDFFDAAKFTTITFKSTSWKKTGEDTYDVTGDLTIKETTKPVVLKTKLLGVGPGPKGSQLSGWEATTTLKKSDFGVNGPAGLSAALGDDVNVTLNIEAKK